MDPSFSNKVAGYSDRQLLDALLNIGHYTPEAVEVIMAEANLRGGVEVITKQVQDEILAEQHYAELVQEIDNELNGGRTVEEITDGLLAKGTLTPEIERLVDQREVLFERKRDSLVETPASAARIVIGGVVASIIGGFYAHVCFANRDKVFFILAIGFLIQPYYTIRWISGGKATTLFYLTVLGSLFGSAIVAGLLLYLGI